MNEEGWARKGKLAHPTNFYREHPIFAKIQFCRDDGEIGRWGDGGEIAPITDS